MTRVAAGGRGEGGDGEEGGEGSHDVERAHQRGEEMRREVRSISISFNRFMDSTCSNCGIFVRFLNLFCLLSPNNHLRHDTLRGGHCG